MLQTIASTSGVPGEGTLTAPNLTSDQVAKVVPEAKIIGQSCKGGQKQVFPCEIDGRKYALKFLATEAPPPPVDLETTSAEPLDETLERARREIAIMEKCKSPHLVKLGPIGLTKVEVEGKTLLYFTEEWIEGQDLRTRIAAGQLPIEDVVRLGLHVSLAIDELWTLRKVHRDIKPGNIVMRSNGDFVLLDLGLALDLNDQSLSALGAVPGTLAYLSPEQMNPQKKRALDFRSDLFALGIVMYQALTQRHPFTSSGMSSDEILAAILNRPVVPPKQLRKDTPDELDAIVVRLLSKHPHLRFRKCEVLREALTGKKKEGGK